jgi:hypothetical protein
VLPEQPQLPSPASTAATISTSPDCSQPQNSAMEKP